MPTSTTTAGRAWRLLLSNATRGAFVPCRRQAAQPWRSGPRRHTSSSSSSSSFDPSTGSAPNSALGGWLWAVPITTFGLGCWQVYRLNWKLDLIEKAESRLHLEPVSLPPTQQLLAPSSASSHDEEYRRVRVSGEFLHDLEMLLGPRTRNDQAQGGGLIGGGNPVGFFSITPFRRADDGTVILVNRGWIPRDKRDKRTRPEGFKQGVIEIEGLMRSPEKANMLSMINNVPEKNEWFWLDIDAMTKLSGAQPLLIEMVRDSEINAANSTHSAPIAREAYVNFRNTHLAYAITWYGLCAFSTAMLWKSKKKITGSQNFRIR
ncbi:surf-like protein [Geranomyces variabilis]|nr:surf-like protein [Geranomyces variabilis]